MLHVKSTVGRDVTQQKKDQDVLSTYWLQFMKIDNENLLSGSSQYKTSS